MAGYFDKLRNAGAGILDGLARSIASFQVRHEQHVTRARENLPKRPSSRRNRREQHLTGERMFSQMMRGAGGIGWPASWTQDRSLQIQQYHRWVYIAIDSIASRIAAMPPQVAIVRPAGERPPLDGPVRKVLEARYKKSLHSIRPHEEVMPVGPNHPLVRLLARPNAWVKSPGRLWYQLVMYLCLTGNGYFWVVPDRAFGRPLEIWVIPSHWCFGPKIGPDGFQYYQVLPFVGGVGGFNIPADEIVHFAFDNPLNPIDGWAPTQAAAEWIDVATAQDQSRYFAFHNGSQANGALELGPSYDPDNLDLDEIGAKFLARYQGVRNAGMPVMLPPDIKFVPLTISPSEMAFIEGFDQMRDAVLATYRVPHEIAGITDAGSHTAYYGPMVQFDENAIFPKVRMIGDTFTAEVCRRWDDNLRLYWEDHSPPDPAELNAKLELDLKYGLRSYNEARAERGLPPVHDPMADELLIPTDRMPLSRFQAKLDSDEQQRQASNVQQQVSIDQQKQQMEQEAAEGQGGGEDKKKPLPVAEDHSKPAKQKKRERRDKNAAEEAALEVNDASWDGHYRGVRKAHEWNRHLAETGNKYRIQWSENEQRWHIANGVAITPSTNGAAVKTKAAKQAAKKPFTIAVDLDGTLIEYDKWHGENHFGAVRPGAREGMQALRAAGCRLIIWTTRGNTDKVRAFLEENHIPFDFINENPDQPPDASGKVIADLYLDDRGVDARKPWPRTVHEVRERLAQGTHWHAVGKNLRPGISKHNSASPGQRLIWLARHGKTKLNHGDPSRDRIRGWRDVPLNEDGRAEAERLAEFFQDQPISAIYCSNLDRTEETARAIAEYHPDVPIKCTESLRPWNVGKFTGELSSTVHPILEEHVRDPDRPIPGGESFNEFKKRCLPYIAGIMEDAEGLPLIVAHFRNLKLVQAWIEAGCQGTGADAPIDLDTFFTWKDLPTGAMLRVDNPGGEWQADIIPSADSQPGTKAKRPEVRSTVPFDDSWHERKAFDESKHPRGKPDNAGQFAEKPGGSAKPSDQATRREPPPPSSGKQRTQRESGQEQTPKSKHSSAAEHQPASAAERSPVHETLESSPMKRAEELKEGTDKKFILTLEDGTLGLFKPSSGQGKMVRSAVPDGTGYIREVAVSRVADTLGMGDLVPVTTFRNQKGEGIGSVQKFVSGATQAGDSAEPFDGRHDASRAAVLDYLVGHLDRHYGNWGLKDDKLVLWDNGLSFPTKYSENDFANMEFWKFAAENKLPMPDLSEWQGKWQEVEKELEGAGLEKEAIDLTKKRFDALTSGQYQEIAELPSLLPDQKNLGAMALYYNYAARVKRHQAAKRRRVAEPPTRRD